MSSAQTVRYGPSGVYQAVWDGVMTLTDTVFADGTGIATYSGQSLSVLASPPSAISVGRPA